MSKVLEEREANGRVGFGMRRLEPMKGRRFGLLLSGVILSSLADLAYTFGQEVAAHAWGTAAFVFAGIIGCFGLIAVAAFRKR